MTGARGWRLRFLVREAVKNVTGTRSRMLPYTISALLAGVLTAIAFTAQWASFEDSVSQFQLKGRSVYLIEASSDERPVSIERSSCERLGELGTVERAGIIVSLGRGPVAPLGGSIPVLGASATLISELEDGHALVGSAISPRDFVGFVDTADGVLPASTGAMQPAGIDTNSALTVPLPVTTDSGTQCIVEMDWRATAQDVSAAAASLHVEGGNITAVPAYRESSSVIDAFLERTERWLPILLGLLGGLATSLAVRSRRGELAAYLFGGASPRAAATLVMLEVAFIGGIAVTSGGATILALSAFTSAPAAGAIAVLALGATWVASALPLSVQMAMVSPVELGKGR
ncbi:hypothetical protein SRABI76_01965 [Microbacterium oxydans]|uniref:hypothetical protein n=1 Tax=Microbacterium oxydans TaxID=82380 RepID=UPI001E003FB1|nr:hypothetical protein [Microbacterium oxydans]CAH0198919.1 hypothetical protein SRABI76_01965 [Microbacterium oxydans]